MTISIGDSPAGCRELGVAGKQGNRILTEQDFQMDTRHPFSSSSRGMAVISLDLAAVLTGPRVRAFREAQALTRGSAPLTDGRSWERRAVLPSTATTSPAATGQ